MADPYTQKMTNRSFFAAKTPMKGRVVVVLRGTLENRSLSLIAPISRAFPAGSIIELIGTEEFPRLRFGIGSDFPKGRQSDYVLSPWNEEERKTIAERIELASKAVLQFGLLGVAGTMNNFNKR